MSTEAWFVVGATTYAVIAGLVLWGLERMYRQSNGYTMEQHHKGITTVIALLWPLSMLGTIIAVLTATLLGGKK